MTSASTFPQRLSRVDGLTLPDHSYLDATDEVYFLGEYTVRRGYAYSATNHLILNFKKSLSTKGQAQWKWKGVAISTASQAFRAALNNAWLDIATLVPIPPSKAKTDPLHDDRMVQMLRGIRPQPAVDVREFIVQGQSVAAAHELANRPGPADILAQYTVDPALVAQPPQVIGIFDDVLTTGAHFKAAQTLLRQQFPQATIIGLFIARRVPETADPDEFNTL